MLNLRELYMGYLYEKRVYKGYCKFWVTVRILYGLLSEFYKGYYMSIGTTVGRMMSGVTIRVLGVI